MPHSQIAEGAIPHLCMDEWKHPNQFKDGLASSMLVLAEPVPVGEVRHEGAQSGGTVVTFCTPSMIRPMCHINVLLIDGPEELFCSSVTQASWQNLLACGKADDLLTESGKREIAWPAFSEIQQVGFCKDRKVVQWYGMQASSHYTEYIIHCCVDDTGVYTGTLDRCQVRCC